MNFIALAIKNLLRRRGRTMLTVMGVAIAISVLFSLLALNTGYEKALGKEMNSLGAHVLAVPKGCPYEAASLVIHGGVIPKYLSAADLKSIRSIDGIDLATPMLMHQVSGKGSMNMAGTANAGKDVSNVVFGVKIDDMLKLKPWWTVDGRFFKDNETNVIVAGRGLADMENLTVGSAIVLGSKKEKFTVVGILGRTGDQDDQFYFMPLAEAQSVFDKRGKITTIAVKVKDLDKISEISDEMEKIPDIQVVTMTQIMGTIMNLAGSAKSLLLTVIIIALVISAFGIINTLLMSVNERTREFGMMKAIGASGLDISKTILAETVFITASGGAIGTALAIVGSSIIEGFVKGMLPFAPKGTFISLSLELIAFSLLFSVGLGLICGIYPAFKSSRLSPMEAIRSGVE